MRRVVYRVRKGDTVSSIAAKYGISQSSVRKTNRLHTSIIRVGQRLVLTVPPKSPRTNRIVASKHNTHVVHRGQTLYAIAKPSIASLRKLNDLDSVRIYAGQQLRIR